MYSTVSTLGVGLHVGDETVDARRRRGEQRVDYRHAIEQLGLAVAQCCQSLDHTRHFAMQQTFELALQERLETLGFIAGEAYRAQG